MIIDDRPLRTLEDTDRSSPLGPIAGLVFLAVAAMVDTGIDLMGSVAAEHGHEAVAQAANDFTWNVVLLYSPGLLAIGLAAASAGLRRRGLPRWLGAFGVLVAVGAAMPWIGVLVGLAWMLALSITELVAGPATTGG